MKKIKYILTFLFIVFSLTSCKIGAKTLEAPVVTLSEDTAYWEINDDAIAFEVNVNGFSYKVSNDVNNHIMQSGDSLKVKAIGDGTNYISSGWSNIVTYTAPNKVEPIVLETPVVSVSNEGVASWNKIANAIKYEYVINNGKTVETTN